MKNLEQHIRDIAHSERVPVDAEHVAGFEQYLKGKKRRRRGLLVLSVIGLTALVATGILLADALSTDSPDITSESVTTSQHVSKPSTDAAPTTGSTSSPEIVDRVSEANQSTEVRRADEGSREVSSSRSAAAGIPAPKHLTIPTPELHEQETAVETGDRAQILPAGKGFRPSFSTTALLSSPSGLHPLPGRRIDRFEPKFAIGPRWHFGATGTWFVHNPENAVGSNGMVFQGGLFATYALSSRIHVRFDGGFTLMDRAVYFKKEASQQELLFRAQSRMSVLEARQFYAYHSGLSLMYRMGRHQVSIGAQAFHIYAAKGDIERITEGSDGMIMTERLNGTWVATSGLKRNPVDILGGYHYTVSDLLEISLTARIPVNEFGTAPTHDEGYLYSSEAYGIVPQVGLSYFIR